MITGHMNIQKMEKVSKFLLPVDLSTIMHVNLISSDDVSVANLPAKSYTTDIIDVYQMQSLKVIMATKKIWIKAAKV